MDEEESTVTTNSSHDGDRNALPWNDRDERIWKALDTTTPSPTRSRFSSSPRFRMRTGGKPPSEGKRKSLSTDSEVLPLPTSPSPAGRIFQGSGKGKQVASLPSRSERYQSSSQGDSVSGVRISDQRNKKESIPIPTPPRPQPEDPVLLDSSITGSSTSKSNGPGFPGDRSSKSGNNHEPRNTDCLKSPRPVPRSSIATAVAEIHPPSRASSFAYVKQEGWSIPLQLPPPFSSSTQRLAENKTVTR